MDVVQLVSAQHDEIGRLFNLASLGVDIGDAGSTLAVRREIDLEHVGVRSQFKICPLQQDRQYRRLRRCLRIVVAAKPLAVAAECAGTQLRAVRVGVGSGCIGGRLGKWVVAHLSGSLGEQGRAVHIGQRRQWIRVAAGSFERIAAGDHVAQEIAGLPGDSADLLEVIEMRLEFVVGDAKVLDRHAFRDESPAIAFFDVAAHAQLFGQRAPMLTVPVHAGTADAVAGQERSQLPIGRCRIFGRVADRQCRGGRVLHQRHADAVGEFIGNARIGEVRIGIAVCPTLQREDIETRGGELHAHDRAGPAKSDQHRVNRSLLGGGHLRLSS